MRAAWTVDDAGLRTVLPDAVRRDASALLQTVESAEAACAGVPGNVEQTLRELTTYEGTKHGTVADAARLIHALRTEADPTLAAPTTVAVPQDESQPPATPAEQACAQAKTAVRAVAPESLETLARAG